MYTSPKPHVANSPNNLAPDTERTLRLPRDMQRADDGLGGTLRVALVPARPGLSTLPSSPCSHLALPGAAGWSVGQGPSSGGAGENRTVTAPRCHVCLCPVGGVSPLFAEQSRAQLTRPGTEPGAVLRWERLTAYHVPSQERPVWGGPELGAQGLGLKAYTQWLGRRKEGTKSSP